MATSSSLSDFEFLGRLGKGCFGEVHKVKRKADGVVYVCKQINISDLTHAEQVNAAREAHIMSSLDSDNVVRYYDSFLEDGLLCIIMEYCDRGDLQRMIKKQKAAGVAMPEDRIWLIAIQILLGLEHLHARRILHRDLKSANVLVCSNSRIKIGDLGVARVLGSGTFFAKTMCGSPYYLSPELVQGQPYNDKSDVWSLGCILCAFTGAALCAIFPAGGGVTFGRAAVDCGLLQPFLRARSHAVRRFRTIIASAHHYLRSSLLRICAPPPPLRHPPPPPLLMRAQTSCARTAQHSRRPIRARSS